MKPEIQVNIHSSIRIQGENTVIYIDPYKIDREVHDADIIFITHDHYDHFSVEDIRKVSKTDTLFVVPKNMEHHLAGWCTFLLSPAETTEVLGIPVEAVASYNIPPKPFHPKSKENLGYVLTVDRQRIYVAGDTDSIPEMKKIRCDIALVPIGGTYTMNYKEAALIVNKLEPKIVIPVHYGSVAGKIADGEKFRSLVADGIETVLLI